jgi:hypothetical protein
MKSPKVVSLITLTWKEFSDEAFKIFKDTFESMGYYMGDVYEDCYGDNGSDTYVLYIAKRKMNKKELLKTFDFLDREEDEPYEG